METLWCTLLGTFSSELLLIRYVHFANNTNINVCLETYCYLQAKGVARYVPPQTNPMPHRWGQLNRKSVSDPKQPPINRFIVSLQTQLRSWCVDRAVRESHPGSGDGHTDVNTHGHLKEQWHGRPVLQGPVVLAAM